MSVRWAIKVNLISLVLISWCIAFKPFMIYWYAFNETWSCRLFVIIWIKFPDMDQSVFGVSLAADKWYKGVKTHSIHCTNYTTVYREIFKIISIFFVEVFKNGLSDLKCLLKLNVQFCLVLSSLFSFWVESCVRFDVWGRWIVNTDLALYLFPEIMTPRPQPLSAGYSGALQISSIIFLFSKMNGNFFSIFVYRVISWRAV